MACLKYCRVKHFCGSRKWSQVSSQRPWVTPVPQGCVGLCMGLLSLVLSCQGRVAEEARHTVLLCSGGYTTVPGHPAALSVWPCARDGALQVKEAKQWILDAMMLSRSLTIQMCSFKYGHQLKAVSWSLEFSGAESCSLLKKFPLCITSGVRTVLVTVSGCRFSHCCLHC